MRRHILTLSFFVLFGFFLHANTLNGEFINDDYKHIVENEAVRDVSSLLAIWQSFNTRTIPGITFALNYHFGQLDVKGYHLFNIVCHILAALCVYVLIVLLLRTPDGKKSVAAGSRSFFAFFVAFIYLVHPVQTQVVAYVTQRFTSMAAVLYLLTVIGYIQFRLSGKRRYYIFALGAMVLGLFTKESIVTIGMIILFCEICFFRNRILDGKACFRRVALFWLAPVLLILILSQNGVNSATRMRYVVGMERFDIRYVFTEMNVLRTYLGRFVYPVHLSFSYDYPIAGRFFQTDVLMSSLVLFFVLVSAIYCFKRDRWISFGLGWFFVTTSVEVFSVIFGNRGVIYDNWLNLPLIGLTIVLIRCFDKMVRNSTAVVFLLTGIVVILSLMTYQRNRIYQTEIGIWEDVVRKQPSAYHHIELGLAYRRKGQFAKALVNFQKALDMDPSYIGARKAIRNVLMEMKAVD
jgi:tetratricopeptide (TPR) repeat protein